MGVFILKQNQFTVALVVLLVVISAFTALINPQQTKALSSSDFNAGYIISDSVFTNKKSMSTSQIQAFLNSKVPTCDTNGQQLSEYGGPDLNSDGKVQRWEWGKANYNQTVFTCLKDYQQGGKSSAQIIYDTSQEFNINPQVLIVLLQKEQALVTDTWPLDTPQYRSATGYGCPDTASCATQYYGFTNQVRWAATMFNAIITNSPTWYTPYVLGVNYIQYNPISSCGGSNVDIKNRATQALYNYTPYQPSSATLAWKFESAAYPSCGAFGNLNFFVYFTDWFGSTSTPPATECDSKVKDVVCVWSVRKSNGSQFLTSSESELSNATKLYGWTNEGIIFYASSTAQQGTTPVHRLRKEGIHYYSADQQEYTNLTNSPEWSDEGVRFYALPSTASTSVSYKIYKLYNSSTGTYSWVKSGSLMTYLLSTGYSTQATAYSSLSGLIPTTPAATSRDNVHSLSKGVAYLYSTSLVEVESAISLLGYQYTGVLTTASSTGSGMPVYRLQRGNDFLYTTATSERDSAISTFGYRDQGIRFYVDGSSDPIYRFINTNVAIHRYVSSPKDAMSLANNGWKYERMLSPGSTNLDPVYRFISTKNGEHFYTIDTNEATSISNKGWKYEGVAFQASSNTGKPVYRLYNGRNHFYTTDTAERSSAINNHAYKYEGVGFYVSESSTSSPVYRLYGKSEHFYTSSSTERDRAVSQYGYTYEGERFDLAPAN